VTSTNGGLAALSSIQEKEETGTLASIAVVSTGSAKTAMYNGLSVSLMDFPEPKQRVPPTLPAEAAMVQPSSLYQNNFEQIYC
jgi:hypothetical protein